MTQNDYGWTEEFKQSFQDSFARRFSEAAEFIAGRYDLLPTRKEIVVAFAAMARQVLQKAETREHEALLIIEDPSAKNHVYEALHLYKTALEEAHNNRNVAKDLSERIAEMDTRAPSGCGRADYGQAVYDLLQYVRLGEKADLTDYSRRPSPELTAEDLFRNLPQDARERLEHFRSPSVSTLAPKG